MFLIIFLILSIPAVQTKLGKYATNKVNEAFKTNINIGKVGLQLNGDVELKAILINDYKNDTLISIGELNASIVSFKNLYNSKLNFGDIDVQDLVFNLKTYNGETDTNLDVFVAKFDDDNPRKKDSEFLLSSSDLSIENGTFSLIDFNNEDPNILVFNNLNANATNFLINGPNVKARINKFSFNDSRGVAVKNVSTNFSYTLSQMAFNNLKIETAGSNLNGNLVFNYQREDFKDFTNKVNLTANFNNSELSLTELNAFYNAFGNNQKAKLSANLSGTLNQLQANNLNLSLSKNSKIIGDVLFKNLFDNVNEFALQGQFSSLSSNYRELTILLPRLLGNSLPKEIDNLGNFKIKGTTNITSKNIIADVNITTNLGFVDADLDIANVNTIDNATYNGNIVLDEFDIGKLIQDPTLGNASANVDVSGKGFKLDKLKTQIKGNVFELEYNNYNYKTVEVSGNLGNKIFNGKLLAKDPNLQLDFNGLVDFSKAIKTFDFKANVGYANLNKLNFVSRDSISEFKGILRMQAKGSNYDDVYGAINIKKTTYKNQDASYKFNDFDIISEFKNQDRTITINSPDIIDGKITGRFKVKDLLPLVENSVGSIYTNYKPNNLEAGQYLNFNFNIYSKIAAVFYKDLELDKNTYIRGRIETDAKGFKLSFRSPKIKFQNYFANKISLSVDNSNPIYNTYIEIDSVANGIYNLSKFNLINVTKRDTLLIKTDFKGGKNNIDHYDLNLFYTIDQTNKSVLGFRKSNFSFKGYEWLINAQKNKDNKLRFDRKFKTLDVFPMHISNGNESMTFSGSIKDSLNQSLSLNFNKVALKKITPALDSLKLNGLVDGKMSFLKDNGNYLPSSKLKITNLNVNSFDLGDLSINANANNSLTNYNVDVNLKNDIAESFSAKGWVNVAQKNPNINLNVVFNDFLIDPLNPLGEGVINNIRGLVSGKANVTGSLKKPDINGELLLDKAGMSIPYLNVDYGFGLDSRIQLRKQQFIFDNIALTDSKYFTKANMNGFVKHHNFSDWVLGLKLTTNRLLVLDTDESEDALYYGTGYVAGKASINGPADQLIINVDGSTAEGTVFNIPLNDAESFGDNSYIHFLTKEEKEARINGATSETIEVKGLELQFDLEVKQNATIEIVIDKEAGSTIKGKGEGNLGFFINTNGVFNMEGDFMVYQGIYNFKYGGIVEKKFEVEQGGHIVWQGDPLKAEINLKALYKTTANPSVLLDNPITQRIPVEVEIALTGQLEQPQPDFNLRFPTVNSTLKSELDYRLSSKDERNNQALTLLGTGGFSSGIQGLNFNGTISERLSGILNNILGTTNENFGVGLDFELGQDTPDLQTDDRLGLTLQTKITDKVLINGKLGVPLGSATQTVITGDVQIDVLLNDDGTLRAKVFNRENTIRNFGEEIGYTQGLGLSYNVEFDTFKELLQIIFTGKNKAKKQKTQTKPKKEEESYFPEYITTKQNKN